MLFFIGHVVMIYIGASIAELEYVDIWRCLVVAIVSFVVMLILGILLSPMLFVPFLSAAFGAAVLFLGTAFAAKMVLSCDWKPAWIIGGTAAVANLIGTLIFG
ncbi:hypothetical protein KDL29_07870 [bacterium]|nr:hypothetical protein [bacterium]